MLELAKQVRFLIAYLALAVLAASVAVAQQPSFSIPMTGGKPEVPNVELTEESAKNSIDTYMILREKYEDKVPLGNNLEALNQGTEAWADINSIVAGNGFKDAGEWQKTIISVVLAQNFLKKGAGQDMDTEIAKMQANQEIPAAVKEQMLNVLKSMRPSDNNIKVVKQLLADPIYSKKIAEFTK